MADTMREKLIELLERINGCCPKEDDCYHCKYEALDDCSVYAKADFLIANGVTVQEWISVKDHTPKERGCYLIAGNHWWDGKPVAREAFWNGDDWLSCYDKGNISRRVTHWQHLPQPPKGE